MLRFKNRELTIENIESPNIIYIKLNSKVKVRNYIFCTNGWEYIGNYNDNCRIYKLLKEYIER